MALRQRQSPSRLRKFLCLKLGSSLSQTYCRDGESKLAGGNEQKGKGRGKSLRRLRERLHWWWSAVSECDGKADGEHIKPLWCYQGKPKGGAIARCDHETAMHRDLSTQTRYYPVEKENHFFFLKIPKYKIHKTVYVFYWYVTVLVLCIFKISYLV